MPLCRIYFFTYKRHDLLPRAIAGLMKQTFTDWICEIHNDMPGDTFPEEFIVGLNDPRFKVFNHSENFGLTKSFNIAFAGCDEKYASILEDDNWWEPDFLKELIAVMDSRPELEVCWSNMRIWQEQPGGGWYNTNRTIWPVGQVKLFDWPQPAQALGAIHSNGAMLFRGKQAAGYQIPANALPNAVEMIRERVFKYPVVLHAKVLANFSETILTSESKDNIQWMGTQIMLLAAFINKSDDKQAAFGKLFRIYRHSRPAPTATFFFAICFYLKALGMLRNFRIFDWYAILKWCVSNILKIRRLTTYLNEQANVWEYLNANTQAFKVQQLTDIIIPNPLMPNE